MIYICIYCVCNKILYIRCLEKKRETKETRKRVERDTWKQSTRVSNINELHVIPLSNLSYLCQSNCSRRIRGTVFFFHSFVVRLAGLIPEEKEEKCKITVKDLATGTRKKMKKRDCSWRYTRRPCCPLHLLSLPAIYQFRCCQFPAREAGTRVLQPF